MEETKKKSGSTFARLFSLGALMFGTYCGGSMASGTYATGYMATFGGGWMLVFLAIFFAFMTFFCAVSLDFAQAYQTKDYNEFALSLYGVQNENANPVIRFLVSLYFDVFNILMGGITAASTVALFGELFNQLFGVPVWCSCYGSQLWRSAPVCFPDNLRSCLPEKIQYGYDNCAGSQPWCYFSSCYRHPRRRAGKQAWKF